MVDSYLTRMLGDREKIVLITHQHWLLLARNLVIHGVLSIVILFIFIFLLAYSQNPWFALGFLALLIPISQIALHILEWKARMFVITNRRVIQLSGMFDKQVADSSLEKVNDVKLNQSFVGRILDYGDIEILTGNESGMEVLRKINQPVNFKKAMLNVKENLGRDYATPGELPENPTPSEERDDIPTLIAKLDILRKRGILTEEEFQRKKEELLSKI